MALSLAPVRNILVQTNVEDSAPSQENMAEFAPELHRQFVGDGECQETIVYLGGAPLWARARSLERHSHRADFWRYVHLLHTGGNYLDIKMRLLQPLTQTLAEIYGEGNAVLQAVAKQRDGQRIAQPPGGQRIAQSVLAGPIEGQPHLSMSRGANQKHVYQGNILA